MKKLLIASILALSFLGCVSAQVGKPFTHNGKKMVFLTPNYLKYEKDIVDLKAYYTATSLASSKNILQANPDLQFDLRFYPDKKRLVALFPEAPFIYNGILEEVLLSSGEDVIKMEIVNFSNLWNGKIPNVTLNKTQANKLYKIFKNSAPIIVRVTTTQGYYDLQLQEKFRPVMAELLEVYFGLKQYNINF